MAVWIALGASAMALVAAAIAITAGKSSDSDCQNDAGIGEDTP